MKRLFALLICLFFSAYAQTSPTYAQAPASKSEGSVLVFGANGQLGSDVVKALIATGRPVSVFVRPSADMKRLTGLSFKTLQGDVLKDDDVAAAFKSAKFSVAIDALARSESGADFYVTSQRNIVKWAQTTGVKQVILHSSVGAGKSRAVYPEAMWPRMKDVLLAKEQGENILIASGVGYTIIRNAQLMPYGTPASGKAKLYEGENKFGGITREDLARLTVECIGNPTCANKILHAVDESQPPLR